MYAYCECARKGLGLELGLGGLKAAGTVGVKEWVFPGLGMFREGHVHVALLPRYRHIRRRVVEQLRAVVAESG